MVDLMPLSDFVEINPKVNLKKGVEYPFVEMGFVTPGRRYVSTDSKRIYKSGGAKFQTGDILFARITPCLENGKIVQFAGANTDIGFGSTEFFVFRHKEGISDPGYVFYLASSDILRKPAEKSMFGASGRQRADLASIKDLDIPAPPLPTQHKIASILSAYDNLIENNTRRIQILEEMAQSLYREWLVEFRFPGYEKVKMVESELGMMPERWEVKKLGELYRTSSGGTPSRKIAEYYGGTINWAKTKELNDNFLFKTEEKITDIGLQKSSAKIFPENTVIMAMYGATIGKLAILAQPASTNQACCAIIKINDLFQHHYIFSFLLVNREKIFSLGAGAAQQNISQTVIQKMKILKPSNTIMKMFNEFVAPNFEHIKSLQLKNRNLRRNRDLLLPKLISGEVDVSSLDITTGELT